MLMDGKIRILFLSANPSDTSRIRVDAEVREIWEKLEEGSARETFELICHPALRPSDLQRLLMKYRPHVVHFSGHGNLVKKIVFEGNFGKSKRIDTQSLVEVFKVFKDDVRVIFLNACLSRPQAQALAGVIDYTIGVEIIGDKAAVIFAGAFYRALAFGMPVQKAFESARAELKIRGITKTKGIELLIREGIDVTEPFMLSDKAVTHNPKKRLEESLRRVATGVSTSTESNLIRQEILDGRLILEIGEEVDENTAVVIEYAGDSEGAFYAEVNTATYRRLQEHLFPPPPGLAPPLPGLFVVGREESLTEVKGLLKSGSDIKHELNLTVVRGWPGVGKTTLVGIIGRDPEILQAFPDGVLWTSLERQPELMSKLAEWGYALGTDELLRAPLLDEAVLRLANLLRHRRMLLIVDDVWDAAHAIPFIKAATGTKCAVLVTTRLTSVAEALTRNEKRIFLLPVLTEENALKLLHHLAPSVVEQSPEQCLELVRDLGCLPLALHVAGRLLKAEAKMGLNASDLINGIREGSKLLPEPAPIDRAEGATLPTIQALLKRSTDELEESIRDCFAYLGPFAPKPATFDLAALKSVWQVENPNQIIRILVGHGLLEPVGNGRFQMHELLVQHARSLLI